MFDGRQTLDWLYANQLAIDDQWALRSKDQFTWWAGSYAQTIRVVGRDAGPNGMTGCRISIKTDFVRAVPEPHRARTAVNEALAPLVSMAGAVCDPTRGKVSLCSCVRIHKGIAEWMNRLLSVAAVLQLDEARTLAPDLARSIGAEPDESAHPQTGWRTDPDEMALCAENMIIPVGKEPPGWAESEFSETVERFLSGPPSLLATSGDTGLTAEFPFGDFSSLLTISCSDRHIRYGAGLTVRQRFPIDSISPTEGARIAQEWNAAELIEAPIGYGFGSWLYADRTLDFWSFYPAVCKRFIMIPNLCFAAAERARAASVRLIGRDWDESSFGVQRSATMRAFERRKGT